MQQLTEQEERLLDSMEGLFFPLLVIKRERGISFSSNLEEVKWERELLRSRVGRLKFYKHVYEAFGLKTLLQYLIK